MTCASCTHFTMKAASDAATEPTKHELSAVGICRRYPPRMTQRGDRFTASLFPNVHRAHVCGEFDTGMPL